MIKRGKLNKGEIAIYETSKKEVDLKVRLEDGTIWLDASQIAVVFGIDRTGIVRHANNIYKTRELEEKSTCAKIAQVAKDSKIRQVNLYNLDMILSIGYRVNSRKATKFRIWATEVLRDHIIKGYTINKKLVEGNYSEFKKAIENVKAFLPRNKKIENKDIVELISVYADTWLSLEAYDKDKLIDKGSVKKIISFSPEELIDALKSLKISLIKKKEATDIFGKERNSDSVSGIIGNIRQSFGGKELYPSVEEKAAHLLYFMVKNHPFIDGNKRSGAFSFVWFLRKANLLRIGLSPEALTALTLLVAESNPKDKDKMIKLVLQMLKKN